MLSIVLISALIAGLLSVDLLVAFQLMLCRPLVAGSLIGMALGEPGAGFATGCLIELVWLGQVPIGSVIPPDFTLGSCFATATAVYCHRMSGLSWEACIFWGLLCSIPVAGIAGYFEVLQRRWHNRLAERVERQLSEGMDAALADAVAASLLVTFFRGFLVVAIAVAVLAQPMAFILTGMAPPAREALDWMYWLSLLLGYAVVLDQFWERRWLRAAGISFLASALALYVFRVSGTWVLLWALAVGSVLAVAHEKRGRSASLGQP